MIFNTDFLNAHINYENYKKQVETIHSNLHSKTCLGSEFCGWLDFPSNITNKEISDIEETSKYIRENYDVLIVCGIGGSYLGAKAAIEALKKTYKNDLEIIFMGQTLSSLYINQIINYIKGKKFAVNVISKSGSTLETSVSFRLLKKLMTEQFDEQYIKESIIVTTDLNNSLLLNIAKKEGYKIYPIPNDIGGRFSVLTAVGLLPIACAGLNIRNIILGAKNAMLDFSNDDLNINSCYQYAIIRNYFYNQGKKVELLISYEPCLKEFGEWYKQLFAESEGKGGKGLFPCASTLSTDLHSIGQFIQDGSPIMFETVLFFNDTNNEITIPNDNDNLDKLNHLSNTKLSYLNKTAYTATLQAHAQEGNVPNIVIEMPILDEKTIGYLFYFFMKACAISAFLLNVNPFDQPGVEIYKKNIKNIIYKDK